MSHDQAAFADLDTLLNASMDDLDDLPPTGVPPSGHYNLTMTMSIEEVGDDKKQVIFASYIIDDINELKDNEEAGEVKAGQQFREGFYVLKRDGKINSFGIGTLKERLKPFVAVHNTDKIGELVQLVKQAKVAASVKRTINKKDPDNYNMKLSDTVVL